MPLTPPGRLVVTRWLRAALPDVGVGDRLPTVIDDPLRTIGFVRVQMIGGSVNTYVPMREPVARAECWVAPASSTSTISPESTWSRAEQLGERIVAATFDRALMGLEVTQPAGNYFTARVHTVEAITDPTRVDNQDNWARVDLDLAFHWTQGA